MKEWRHCTKDMVGQDARSRLEHLLPKLPFSQLIAEGPVLRLAPNLLSFTDPCLLPIVYHRAAEKTPFYSTGLAGDIAPLLQIQSHGEHATKQKILAPTVRCSCNGFLNSTY